VAGIAAAVTNNAVGVAGVAADAELLPVRVLDGSGGNSTDIGRGIKWATDNGADVINLSLGTCIGTTFPCVPATFVGRQTPIVDAIEYAHAAGVVVVGAAGNETFPLCGHPSYEQGVLCVAATDLAGLPADYSNRPIKPDFTTLSAPGGGTAWSLFCDGGIISTVPPGTGASGGGCNYPTDQAYDSATGTSVAAPHVSGAAALLAGLGCTRAEIIHYLTSTAWQPLPYVTEESGSVSFALSQRGAWTPTYGYGIVDAAAAAAAAAPVCTA
jgi:subtilisin family serine protease